MNSEPSAANRTSAGNASGQRQTAKRRRVLVLLLLCSVIAGPILIYLGALGVFFSKAIFVNVLSPDQIIMSVDAPNGKYRAKVVKYMEIEMGQKFMIRDQNGKKSTVGSTGDFNHVKRIHWAPDSSIVVFEQYVSLLAVQLPEVKGHYVEATHAVTNSGIKEYEIDRIEFPKPNTFVIYFEDGTTSQTVDLKTYKFRRNAN